MKVRQLYYIPAPLGYRAIMRDHCILVTYKHITHRSSRRR